MATENKKQNQSSNKRAAATLSPARTAPPTVPRTKTASNPSLSYYNRKKTVSAVCKGRRKRSFFVKKITFAFFLYDQ